jgi:hypothetical protein
MDTCPQTLLRANPEVRCGLYDYDGIYWVRDPPLGSCVNFVAWKTYLPGYMLPATLLGYYILHLHALGVLWLRLGIIVWVGVGSRCTVGTFYLDHMNTVHILPQPYDYQCVL